MFFVIAGTITLVTALLPFIMRKLAGRYGWHLQSAPAWLPVLAAVLYVSALYLPDIHLTTETKTFQEHFVGGGLYTATLYVYLVQLFGWRPKWPVALFGLFAWASALGVLNELAEFAVTKLGLTRIALSDTSWDLVANTSGALVGYFIYLLLKRLDK